MRIPIKKFPDHIFNNIRTKRTPELVLFILWNNGLKKEEKILKKIFKQIKPLIITSKNWPNNEIRNNISLLYNRPKNTLFDKEKECGHGDFLIILGIDYSPSYVWSKRKGGLSNSKTYSIKQSERKNGKNHLHASDTEYDAIQFAMKLLNKPEKYFVKLKEDSLQNKYRPFIKNLSEFFEILNKNTKYVVLRNWELLPDKLLPGHGDVDLLVEDKPKILSLFPEIIKFPLQSHRTQYRLPFDKNWFSFHKLNIIPFDFRFVGDNYYEKQWQKQILNNGILSEKGFYHPNNNDHFWSLLYHAVYHKPNISPDYKIELSKIGQNINEWSDDLLNDINGCEKLLKSKFKICKPLDKSVYWRPNYQ